MLDHRTPGEIGIHAVRQVQAGESPEAVIGVLGFSSRCIYSWLAMYQVGDWDALRAKRIPGGPKKLNAQEIPLVYRTVTRRNPVRLGFPSVAPGSNIQRISTALSVARLALSAEASGSHRELLRGA